MTSLKIQPLLYYSNRQKFQEWKSTLSELHFPQFSVLIRMTDIFPYSVVQMLNRRSSASKLILF
jgi:hypothetical protein